MPELVRVGVMLPLDARPFIEHAGVVHDLETRGYDDLWVGEITELDAVSTLALASQWTRTMGVGSAVLPVFTRGPAVARADP